MDIFTAFIIFGAHDKLAKDDFDKFKSEFFSLLEQNRPGDAEELIRKLEDI